MKIIRFLGIIVVIVVASIYFLCRPYAGFHGETFVEIRKGASTRDIGAQLARAGVIEYEWEWMLARMVQPRAKLQAGEYRFAGPDTPLGVFGRIARGDVFYYDLAVPEGQNLFDIAASLDRLGVISGREFLRAARDPSMIRDLAPRAPTLEGFLFPDTYRITRHASGQELCRMMTQRFRSAWRQLDTKADVAETVTLASLIEKEAAAAEDGPLIASVFRNRLRIGMKLDCDPTTVYAALLEGRYHGTIHQSDLNSPSAYNTYRHPGLPPGPIANPGKASLEAALHPARTDYFYFVARGDGSGRHQFSREIAAHRVAVNRYRRVHR